MQQWARKLLKPIFDMAAAPGIGLPHHEYEHELMARGAKPVMITDRRAITPELQQAMDDGNVTEVFSQTFESKRRVYMRPEAVDSVSDALKSLAVIENDPNDPDFQENAHKWFSCLNQHGAHESLGHDFSTRQRQMDKQLNDGELPQEFDALMDGRIGMSLPVSVDPRQEPSLFDQAVARGDLAVFEYTVDNPLCVLAQKDKIAEGQELTARYYNDGKGYPALDGVEVQHRIGELLGYTGNDVAYFMHEKYKHPWVRELLQKTEDVRRWCRKETMLSDHEDRQDLGQESDQVLGADKPHGTNI